MKNMSFEDLWIGDRFYYAEKTLWTKVSNDTARHHSKYSIDLKEKGYGYMADSVCSFNLKDKVEFVVV